MLLFACKWAIDGSTIRMTHRYQRVALELRIDRCVISLATCIALVSVCDNVSYLYGGLNFVICKLKHYDKFELNKSSNMLEEISAL
jgi:hypothetical protein